MNSYCELLLKNNNLECEQDCKNCAFNTLVRVFEYESVVINND